MISNGRHGDAYTGAVAATPALLGRVCTRWGVPGAVIGIGDASGRSWLAAWGSVRTAGRPEPALTTHRFLLSSVTKVITAAQALTLVADGMISIDEPIQRLISTFGCNGKERITIAHILSHTSGVRRRTANTAEQMRPEMSADDHLACAIRARSSWKPGSRVEYSSSQFWVLGELISAIRCEPYAKHLSTWMRDLGIGITYASEPSSSDRYVEPIEPQPARFAEQSRRVAYPAGGMVASTSDLLRFGSAFLMGCRDAFLPREVLERMCVPVTAGLPGPREPRHRGAMTERALGWAVGGPGRMRPAGILWHTGVSGTGLWVDRNRGLVLAFLSAKWFLPRAFFGSLVDGVLGEHSGRSSS